MNIALIVFGILYLNGYSVGTALAICAIVEGFLTNFFKRVKDKLEEY